MLVREGNKICVCNKNRVNEFLGFSKKEKFSKIGELMHDLNRVSHAMYIRGEVKLPIHGNHAMDRKFTIHCDNTRYIKEGDVKKALDIWNAICKKFRDLVGGAKFEYLGEIKQDIKSLYPRMKKDDLASLSHTNKDDLSEYKGAALVEEDGGDVYTLYFIFDSSVFGWISYEKDKIKKWCKENDVPYTDINLKYK